MAYLFVYNPAADNFRPNSLAGSPDLVTGSEILTGTIGALVSGGVFLTLHSYLQFFHSQIWKIASLLFVECRRLYELISEIQN